MEAAWLLTRPAGGAIVEDVDPAALACHVAEPTISYGILRPADCQELTAREYDRIRQPPYRILHEVDDDAAAITIGEIAQ